MILTIDVGIKNLALCMMDCESPDDLSTYKIHLWDVYNTLEEPVGSCEGTLKNGKVCGKRAMYKDNNTMTCKTHGSKSAKMINRKKVDDFLLQDIATIITKKIQEVFDANTDLFHQVKKVMIELQPKVNNKMKFISHIIYGKFVELYLEKQVSIRFVRAAQKLKAYTGPKIECSLRGAYAQRKWLSVQYTKWFLSNKFDSEQEQCWLPLLNDSPDKCDTFLMAINVLHGVPKVSNRRGKCIA